MIKNSKPPGLQELEATFVQNEGKNRLRGKRRQAPAHSYLTILCGLTPTSSLQMEIFPKPTFPTPYGGK